ncbi:MAG TPA: FHA domain-containing protein, partial [Candidatus Binataceae bacterium]|nr:FHA domain-containing protein [Candidatus Binataceae bacterium]
PFRPEAQGILILITDAPNHTAGDGSAHTQHDQAFWDHHPDKSADVTNLTGDEVAAMLKKNGLTLYAVVPPPFIAPDYAKIVADTHGRSYNIVTEEGRFDELVREIGHSIATEYSLTYRTPRPIEDGTTRDVELKVNYDGQSAIARTSYQVRGVGGARINVPEDGGSAAGANVGGTGLTQLSFQWWNGAIPIIAILGLFGLSRMKFGMSAEELSAILEARDQPASIMPSMSHAAPRSAAPMPSSAPTVARPIASAASLGQGARLMTVNPIAPVAGEYALLKDEISLGRGEENDLVIPHASISRNHARLMRRDGGYELTDLNSTNGTFVNNQQLRGSTMVSNGCELRLGDVIFVFQL